MYFKAHDCGPSNIPEYRICYVDTIDFGGLECLNNDAAENWEQARDNAKKTLSDPHNVNLWHCTKKRSICKKIGKTNIYRGFHDGKHQFYVGTFFLAKRVDNGST